MAAFCCALDLLGNVAADQIAQGIHRRVGDAVVDTGASALAGDEAVLGHQRQVARNVGSGKAAQLRQLADVVLALAKKIEDAQARWLGQGLEVRSDLLQCFRG